MWQVREALAELRDRYADATSRQAEAEAKVAAEAAAEATAGAGPGAAARSATGEVGQVLQRQAERILTLERYLGAQEAAFARLLEHAEGRSPAYTTPSASPGAPTCCRADDLAASGLEVATAAVNVGDGTFHPTYEWQLLAAEALSVPPGLQVDLPLDGHSLRRARIPPVWRLRVWVDDSHGFWRTDVTRSTRMEELRDAASTALGTAVRLRFVDVPHEPVDLASSAEVVRLFERQEHLRLDLEMQ